MFKDFCERVIFLKSRRLVFEGFVKKVKKIIYKNTKLTSCILAQKVLFYKDCSENRGCLVCGLSEKLQNSGRQGRKTHVFFM